MSNCHETVIVQLSGGIQLLWCRLSSLPCPKKANDGRLESLHQNFLELSVVSAFCP